jgi:hypothetical protein
MIAVGVQGFALTHHDGGLCAECGGPGIE